MSPSITLQIDFYTACPCGFTKRPGQARVYRRCPSTAPMHSLDHASSQSSVCVKCRGKNETTTVLRLKEPPLSITLIPLILLSHSLPGWTLLPKYSRNHQSAGVRFAPCSQPCALQCSCTRSR
jgi:hypothetical protein